MIYILWLSLVFRSGEVAISLVRFLCVCVFLSCARKCTFSKTAKATITFHSRFGVWRWTDIFLVFPASSSSSHPQFELAIFQIEFIMNLRANEVLPSCLPVYLSATAILKFTRFYNLLVQYTVEYRHAVPSIVISPVSYCWNFKIIFCNYILFLSAPDLAHVRIMAYVLF